jgi:hypothetical protein
VVAKPRSKYRVLPEAPPALPLVSLGNRAGHIVPGARWRVKPTWARPASFTAPSGAACQPRLHPFYADPLRRLREFHRLPAPFRRGIPLPSLSIAESWGDCQGRLRLGNNWQRDRPEAVTTHEKFVPCIRGPIRPVRIAVHEEAAAKA